MTLKELKVLLERTEMPQLNKNQLQCLRSIAVSHDDFEKLKEASAMHWSDAIPLPNWKQRDE